MLKSFKEAGTKVKVLILAVLAVAVAVFGIMLHSILSDPDVDMVLSAGDYTYDPEANDYTTPLGETLPRGIYDITIDYSAEWEVEVKVTGHTYGNNGIYSDDPVLSETYNRQSFVIWINEECTDFQISLLSEVGNFVPGDIHVKTAWNSKIYGVTKLILAYLAIIALVVFIYYRKRLSKYSFEIVSLFSIAFICSLGLFVRYIIPGHDYIFHMMRIEGIKDSILLGDIPAKVQANWCYDWGYAVSAAYGDVTLLFPALLRLAGFTIQAAYKAFVISVNITTVLVCYFCFRKMCKDPRVVIFMTMLYSFAPYRLACLYYREATGEYTGMIFLPMIALGFYHAYMDDVNDKDYGKRILVPALGFSFLMQSHLVTCVMAGMFIVILCIANWKKTFSPKTFIYLAKIAIFSALITLWFLVPMFVFLREDLIISSVTNYWPGKQNFALSLTEVFAQRISGTTLYNHDDITSLSERFTTPLGNAFVLMAVVYIYLVWKDRITENKKAGCLLLGMGALATYMTTILFPYAAIWKLSKKVGEFLLIVQYQYRYLTMAIIIFTVMIPFVYKQISEALPEKIFIIIAVLMIVIALDQTVDIIYKGMYNGEQTTCYDIISLDNNAISGKEYVYYDTDVTVPITDHEPFSENVNLDTCTRWENRFDITVSSAGENASVSLPLYYYPGYTAWTESGDLLIVDRGDNNRVKISVPAGYSGGIKLRYRERKLWRLCEVISIIAWIALIFVEFDLFKKIRDARNGNKDKEPDTLKE